MIKVLFLPEVVDHFLELAEVLYNKGYLGFKDIAIDYAEKLFRDIQANLHTKVKKNAPTHFDRSGQGIFTHYSQEIIIPHGTYFTVSMKLMIRPYT